MPTLIVAGRRRSRCRRALEGLRRRPQALLHLGAARTAAGCQRGVRGTARWARHRPSALAAARTTNALEFADGGIPHRDFRSSGMRFLVGFSEFNKTCCWRPARAKQPERAWLAARHRTHTHTHGPLADEQQRVRLRLHSQARQAAQEDPSDSSGSSGDCCCCASTGGSAAAAQQLRCLRRRARARGDGGRNARELGAQVEHVRLFVHGLPQEDRAGGRGRCLLLLQDAVAPRVLGSMNELSRCVGVGRSRRCCCQLHCAD